MPTVREVAQRPPFKPPPQVLDPPEDNPGQYAQTDTPFLRDLFPPVAPVEKPQTIPGLDNPGQYASTETPFTRGPLPPLLPVEPPRLFAPIVEEIAAAVEAIFVRGAFAADPAFVPPPKVFDATENPGQYAQTETPFTQAAPLEPPPFLGGSRLYFVLVEEIVAAVEPIFVRAAAAAEPAAIAPSRAFVVEVAQEVAAALELLIRAQPQKHPAEPQASRAYFAQIVEEAVAITLAKIGATNRGRSRSQAAGRSAADTLGSTDADSLGGTSSDTVGRIGSDTDE